MIQGSPSGNDRHLLICQPAVSKGELDPEDGLYDQLTWDLWKSYKNAEGQIHDSTTVRKARLHIDFLTDQYRQSFSLQWNHHCGKKFGHFY